MELIREAECFDPAYLGCRDVLVGGGAILAIAEPGQLQLQAREVDGRGMRMVPGFVDALTHPCGGGGEGGFGNRTAEIPISEFVRAGVTTPVGALGTDSLGRSLDVLYGNVMALRAGGLSAYMLTGAYRVPAPTLTGDVSRDIYLVDPVVGVGEVAIADHRGTQPTVEELRRLGAEARLGGVLTGCGGVVLIHVGDGDERLELLRRACDGSELPPTVFYPTHVNRSRALLEEAADWARAGGFVDVTVSTTPELIEAGDIPALDALDILATAGAPLERVTLSSDAGGSLPLYVNGVLEGLVAASPSSLPELLAEVPAGERALYERVLATLTANPGRALGIPAAGRIRVGEGADLLLLDDETGQVRFVMGKGRWLLRDGMLV